MRGKHNRPAGGSKPISAARHQRLTPACRLAYPVSMPQPFSWTELDLPPDGRQSERALNVQRGVCRHLMGLSLAPLTEFTLASGRRADVIALASNGDITIIEIKTSLADLRADTKWPEYRDFCDRLFFAVPEDFPMQHLPPDAGLMVADRYGAEPLRDAPVHKLSAARRKAVTVRLARASALRLSRLADPEAGLV